MLSFLHSPTLTSIHGHTWKTIALTRQTFVGKVMSLLLNMLSRLVITFLPRSKRLLISWLLSPPAVILEPPKIKSDTVSTVSPSIKWWDQMPWSSFSECWVLSQLFHSTLSPSSRGSLVPLCFTPQGWCHLHIWGYWSGNLDWEVLEHFKRNEEILFERVKIFSISYSSGISFKVLYHTKIICFQNTIL